MSKFKVLWIDDQTRKCKREVKAVSNLIKSLGFEPEITFETNISKRNSKNNGRRNGKSGLNYLLY